MAVVARDSSTSKESAPARGTRPSRRNIAAALVVAGRNFSDPLVVVMIVVLAVVGLIILMPLARALGR